MSIIGSLLVILIALDINDAFLDDLIGLPLFLVAFITIGVSMFILIDISRQHKLEVEIISWILWYYENKINKSD